MPDRNTIVGIDFLAIGATLSALGYVAIQSEPITALGVGIGVVGALLLLIVPEVVPHDVYLALLRDSIANVELILQESHLKNRAYFLPLKSPDSIREEIRAFVPLQVASSSSNLATGNRTVSLALTSEVNVAALQSYADSAPRRLITSQGDIQGLFLIPPGNEIVKLADIEEGGELEDSLKTALVDFSDLAASVLVAMSDPKKSETADGNVPAAPESSESQGSRIIKMNIKGPRLTSTSEFFNSCLGTPISCVACCVTAAVTAKPVRIVEETYDAGLIRLTLERF
jgi:hypothetical protein